MAAPSCSQILLDEDGLSARGRERSHGSTFGPSEIDSFQPHSLDDVDDGMLIGMGLDEGSGTGSSGALHGDTVVARLLLDDGAGCCSSGPSDREDDTDENADLCGSGSGSGLGSAGSGGNALAIAYDDEGVSPSPEFLPTLDWASFELSDAVSPSSSSPDRVASPLGRCLASLPEGGASLLSPVEATGHARASPTSTSPSSSSSNDEHEGDSNRRRYRRAPRRPQQHTDPTAATEECTLSPLTAARRAYAARRPPLDMAQQRQIIAAERARRREDINAMMQQQQQMGGAAHLHAATKILCNEAHRRHCAQVAERHRRAETARLAAEGAAPLNSLPSTPRPAPLALPRTYTAAVEDLASSDKVPSAATPSLRVPSSEVGWMTAAWRGVAECVEEGLFFPAAVQARLSCMGIFRSNMTPSDLICYDDHEQERFAIRTRQMQIINTIRCQAMAGGNGFFLERPFPFAAAEGALGVPRGFFSEDHLAKEAAAAADRADWAEEESYSPTHFIAMGDFE